MSRTTTPTREFFTNFEGFLKKFKLTKEDDKDKEQEIVTLANLDSGRIRKFIVKKVDEKSLFGLRKSDKSKKDENENKAKKLSKKARLKRDQKGQSPTPKRRFSSGSLSSLKSLSSANFKFFRTKSLHRPKLKKAKSPKLPKSPNYHFGKKYFGGRKFPEQTGVNGALSDCDSELDDVFTNGLTKMTVEQNDFLEDSFRGRGEAPPCRNHLVNDHDTETKSENGSDINEDSADSRSISSDDTSSISDSPRFNLKMSPVPKRSRRKDDDPGTSPVSFRSGYQSNRSSISSARKGILKKTNSCTTINMEMTNLSRPDSPLENGINHPSSESIDDKSLYDDTRFQRSKDNPHYNNQRSFNRVKFILDSGRPDNITGDYDDIKMENKQDRIDAKQKLVEKDLSPGTSRTGRKCLIFTAGLLMLTMAVILGSFFGARKSTKNEPITAQSQSKIIGNSLEGKFRIMNVEFTDSMYDTNSADFRKMSNALQDVILKAILSDAKLSKNSTATINYITLRIVKYELIDRSTTAMFRTKWREDDKIDVVLIRNNIIKHLDKFGGFGEYKVDPTSFSITSLKDLCLNNPQWCSHICQLNDETLRFGCSCPDDLIVFNRTHCATPNITSELGDGHNRVLNKIASILKNKNTVLQGIKAENPVIKPTTNSTTSSEKPITIITKQSTSKTTTTATKEISKATISYVENTTIKDITIKIPMNITEKYNILKIITDSTTTVKVKAEILKNNTTENTPSSSTEKHTTSSALKIVSVKGNKTFTESNISIQNVTTTERSVERNGSSRTESIHSIKNGNTLEKSEHNNKTLKMTGDQITANATTNLTTKTKITITTDKFPESLNNTTIFSTYRNNENTTERGKIITTETLSSNITLKDNLAEGVIKVEDSLEPSADNTQNMDVDITQINATKINQNFHNADNHEHKNTTVLKNAELPDNRTVYTNVNLTLNNAASNETNIAIEIVPVNKSINSDVVLQNTSVEKSQIQTKNVIGIINDKSFKTLSTEIIRSSTKISTEITRSTTNHTMSLNTVTTVNSIGQEVGNEQKIKEPNKSILKTIEVKLENKVNPTVPNIFYTTSTVIIPDTNKISSKIPDLAAEITKVSKSVTQASITVSEILPATVNQNNSVIEIEPSFATTMATTVISTFKATPTIEPSVKPEIETTLNPTNNVPTKVILTLEAIPIKTIQSDPLLSLILPTAVNDKSKSSGIVGLPPISSVNFGLISNVSHELSKNDITELNQNSSTASYVKTEISTTTSITIAAQKCKLDEYRCSDGDCIPKRSQCDSVYDCADHSDEKDCIANKCLDNYQCRWNGDCLSRNFVCDGIKHCTDGDDEESCLTWKCTDSEFTCKNGNFSYCIPLSFKCDGHSDCPSREDEMNCTEECSKDKFKCSEGSCIPNLWKCDGVEDCKNGEDEKECACEGLDQTPCRVGGCVPTFKVCDGLRQCPDGSDEWGCLKIENDTKQFQVKSSGTLWSSVCGDRWTSKWTDLVCEQLGFGVSLSTEVKRITGSILKPRVKLSSDATDVSRIKGTPLQYFMTPDKCAEGPIVHISCSEQQCGQWNYTNSLSYSESVKENNWPSLGLLIQPEVYDNSKEVYHESCSASIVTPIWVITTYSCIVSKAGSLKAEKWAFLVGEQMPKVEGENTEIRHAKQIVAYPGAKRNRNIWVGDAVLVRLHSSLSYSLSVKPVCLSEDTIQSNEECVIASWKTSAEDYYKRQTIQPLPTPNLTPNTCNTSYYAGKLTTHHTCASFIQSAGSPCTGSEGAPFMCRVNNTLPWKLAGILSHIGYCAKFEIPSLFTDIGKIYPWIMSTIGRPLPSMVTTTARQPKSSITSPLYGNGPKALVINSTTPTKISKSATLTAINNTISPLQNSTVQISVPPISDKNSLHNLDKIEIVNR